MHVVIFEGSRWPTFAPLSLSRPVFTLLSGATTLLEKQVRHLKPSRLTLWVRPEMADHARDRLAPLQPVPTAVNVPLDDEPALLVSGRKLLFNDYECPNEFSVITESEASGSAGDVIRSAYTRSPGLGPEDVMRRSPAWMKLMDLPRIMPQGRMVESLWDLIQWNEESLIADAVQAQTSLQTHPAGPYHMIRAEDIYLAQGAKLEPGCVLDASRGPIVLGEKTGIGANAVIQGPCYIGSHSSITPLSLIRPGVTIGPMCKIGGEVSNSIVLGYSNKAHEGFLGDSYLGKWVNFGAGTTTSNMKNTYGQISVRRGEASIPTGRRFLGALVGDHSKTGILTRLSAGTYIGFCSSLAGEGPPARFVPSYTFETPAGRELYELDRALDVTRRVYARRDRPFTSYDEHVMRYVAGIAPEIER